MPITKSAKKALRRDKRREKINLRIKRQVKTTIKNFRQNPTQKNLREVFSSLDKAVKKYVFHKNKTGRLKSRLSKLLKPITKH